VGHIRLGVLPKSRKWQQVVEQLRLGADVAAVAGFAAEAAETSLKGASNDPAFLHAFWLLTQIPLAARGPAFAEDLRRLGLEVSNQPSLMDVAAAFSGAVGSRAAKADERGLNFMLSVVKGVKPRDQVETLLAAQIRADKRSSAM
jgi:uroporphyrinogen-III synthase